MQNWQWRAWVILQMELTWQWGCRRGRCKCLILSLAAAYSLWNHTTKWVGTCLRKGVWCSTRQMDVLYGPVFFPLPVSICCICTGILWEWPEAGSRSQEWTDTDMERYTNGYLVLVCWIMIPSLSLFQLTQDRLVHNNTPEKICFSFFKCHCTLFFLCVPIFLPTAQVFCVYTVYTCINSVLFLYCVKTIAQKLTWFCVLQCPQYTCLYILQSHVRLRLVKTWDI